MEQNNKYYAFISYKREDAQWAAWLQHKLEHYKLPANLNGRTDLPREIRPVFRDTSELNPGNLPQQIHDALEASQYLIVICSPRSAKSEWVNKEIETFIAMGKRERIIPFIVDGRAMSSDPEEECFPPAIRNLPAEQELLGANITEMGRDAAAVKTVAQMFGVRFDTLWGRYEREQKRRRNWIIAAVAVFVLAVMGVAAYIWQQDGHLKEAVSRAAAEKAMQMIDDGDAYTARKVAMEALDLAYTPEAEAALRQAWQQNNAVLRGHTDKVHSTAFSPDGKLLASVSDDNTIRIWDVATGQGLLTIDSVKSSCVKFTPDGNSVITSGKTNTIRIWNVKTGQCLKMLPGNSIEYSAICSPDGKYIVSIGNDATIHIWDAQTNQCLRNLSGHMADISSLDISPDGKRLVSASDDRTVRLWDIETGKCLQVLTGKGSFLSASFSQDGKYILSVSLGEYNFSTTTSDGEVYYTVMTTDDQGIRIWDTETGECIRLVEKSFAHDALFLPDGKSVVSIGKDGIRILETETGNCVRTLDRQNTGFQLSISSDGRIISAAKDNSINLWNIEEEQSVMTLNGHTQDVNDISYSLDGKYIVTASNDSTIRIWDSQTGSCLRILADNNKGVNSAKFSPDGKLIVSASDDKTIRIWDATTGQCIRILDSSLSAAATASFSPDGKLIVAPSNGKTIRVWNVTTGENIQTLEGYAPGLCNNFAIFTPDGKRILSKTDNHALCMWDLETGQCLQKYSGHSWMVLSVAISPDGKRIASSSFDNTVRIWDTETGQCLRTFEGRHFSSSLVCAVGFSSDGHYLLSVSDDDVCIFDETTGLPLWTLKKRLLYTIFSPDGRYIVSAIGRDGTIEIINIPTLQELIDRTREQFKDNSLTPEERRKYYLR